MGGDEFVWCRPLATERRAEVEHLGVQRVLHQAQQIGAGRGSRQPQVALGEPLQLPEQYVARALQVVPQCVLRCSDHARSLSSGSGAPLALPADRQVAECELPR
jgi:hypothetical protein